MSLSTILNNSRPNKYPLANVMQSLNHPQIIKNLVFVFTLFSASLFSIKRPMLLIIKHTLPPLKWIAKSPNSIKEPCYYLQSEKKICLARQFKLLRNHIQASKTRIFFPNNNRWDSLKAGCTQTQPAFDPTNSQNDWLTSFAHFCFDKSSSSGSPPQRVPGGRQLNRGAGVGLVVAELYSGLDKQQQDKHFVDLVHTTSLSDCLKMWHECWKKVSKGWRADIRLCNKNSEFAFALENWMSSKVNVDFQPWQNSICLLLLILNFKQKYWPFSTLITRSRAILRCKDAIGTNFVVHLRSGALLNSHGKKNISCNHANLSIH